MANKNISVGVKIGGDAKGFKTAAEDAKKATQKLKKEIDFKKQQQNINKLTSTLGKLGIAFSGLVVAQKMGQLIKESFQLAVAAEGIEIAFKRLNNPALLDELRAATKGTVDDITLMQKAVQANNLGVPVKNLATYFEFAHRRARDTGESVDYLVNSIVTGIGRKSTMILDNLGISSVELNEQLKLTPDYATAVSTIIERSMSQSGEYITTTADTVDQLKTAMTNLKTEVGNVFNDILAKPLSEAATSLTEVISGISELRRQLDLGGANKDLANFVRGNISMASGTAGGYFMAALFGGNDLGKGELLIPAAKPIIKPTSTPKPTPSSSGGDDLIYGEGYLQRQVQAAAEWNQYIEQLQRKYDIIDISGKSIATTSLSQVQTSNQLAESLDEVKQRYIDISESSYILESTFVNLFAAGMEGWEEFGKAAESVIKQIAAEVLARAAVWTLLNILTGGTATGGMKLKEYVLKGFGISTKSASAIGSGGTVLKGRDIYMSGNRYGETLIKNT